MAPTRKESPVCLTKQGMPKSVRRPRKNETEVVAPAAEEEPVAPATEEPAPKPPARPPAKTVTKPKKNVTFAAPAAAGADLRAQARRLRRIYRGRRRGGRGSMARWPTRRRTSPRSAGTSRRGLPSGRRPTCWETRRESAPRRSVLRRRPRASPPYDGCPPTALGRHGSKLPKRPSLARRRTRGQHRKNAPAGAPIRLEATPPLFSLLCCVGATARVEAAKSVQSKGSRSHCPHASNAHPGNSLATPSTVR